MSANYEITLIKKTKNLRLDTQMRLKTLKNLNYIGTSLHFWWDLFNDKERILNARMLIMEYHLRNKTTKEKTTLETSHTTMKIIIFFGKMENNYYEPRSGSQSHK